MRVAMRGGGELTVADGAVEITPAIRFPAAWLQDCSVEPPRKRKQEGAATVELKWTDPERGKIKAKLACDLPPEEAGALEAAFAEARAVDSSTVSTASSEECPPGSLLDVAGPNGSLRFDGEVLVIPLTSTTSRVLAGQIEMVGVDPPGKDGNLAFWVQWYGAEGRTVSMCPIPAANGSDLARLLGALEAARRAR